MMFIEGLLFGLTLQLSIGPCFFAVLHRSLKKGFVEGFKMVLGVALVDSFYIFLSFTFVGSLLKIYFLNRLVLWGGALALIMFGFSYIKNAKKKSSRNGGSQVREVKSKDSSFIYGISLTAANPITILFWSGAFGALISTRVLTGIFSILTYSAGCVTSTVLFLGLVCIIGKRLESFLTDSVLQKLDYAVGAFLIAFGIKLVVT